MADEEEATNGTVLQGNGGAVYFIPDDQLETFRIGDEEAASVNEVLDSEVEGFAYSKVGIEPMIALNGPIGLKTTEGDPDEEPTLRAAFRKGFKA